MPQRNRQHTGTESQEPMTAEPARTKAGPAPSAASHPVDAPAIREEHPMDAPAIREEHPTTSRDTTEADAYAQAHPDGESEHAANQTTDDSLKHQRTHNR